MECMIEQEEKEVLTSEGKSLRLFLKEIKRCSIKNIDELHMNFVNDNPDLTIEEVCLVKQVFDYIKERC